MSDSDGLPVDEPFVSLQASGDGTQAAAAWYNSSWAYRKKITVDHTKVGENLVRYPMYVSLDGDTDIASRAQVDRDDVLFTSADGVTKLDHELIAPRATAGGNITQMDSNGAWCWFGDPRGLYHEGQRKQTYLGWVDNVGSIYVAAYNHVSRTSQKVKLHDRLQRDDHANPSLMMRADGRLMVFYSAHAGPQMYYRIASNVEEISSWAAERTVPTNTSGTHGYTYPNPVQLSAESNRIFLFWRGGNFNPTYSTSGDGGATWAAAKTLFSVPGQRPYVKVVSNNRDEIHFTLTDGHPRDVPNNNVYHFYYKNGGFYRSDGTFIKSVSQLPLLPGEVTKVYDAVSGGSKGWTWDIALDATGKPVITYANFPTSTDHRYRYARWDGTAWQDHEITRGGPFIGDSTEPNYSGGIVLDGKNPSVAYLSRQVGTAWEVEKWVTATGGASWTSQALTTGSGTTKNVRPFVPRNRADDALNVIWMSGSYPSFTTYDTGLKGYPALEPGAVSSEAYVEIPTTSSTVNTEIYIYYGNPSVADQSNPTATWGASYRAVHHLNDTTSTMLNDSTANNVDGTKQRSTNPVEANARINKAQKFDGNNNAIYLATLSLAGWSALSVEAWFTYEKEFKATKHTLISSWQNGGDILVRIDTATNKVEAYVRASGKVQVGGTFADLTVDDQPHYLAVTYDTANGLRAYLDGRRSTTVYAQKGALDSGATGPLRLGATPHTAADSFRGKLDEVRLSNFVRSAAWIAAQSLNMSSPSSFYSLAPQEARPL